MNQVISATHLSFKYSDRTDLAIKDISFSLNNGESLGILGPNGGGKSTLMKILSGLITNFTGELKLFQNIQNSKSKFPYDLISYVPQTTSINFSLPLKAIEYLEIAAKSMNLSDPSTRINLIAKDVGILDKLNFQFKEMSGGEQQRVLLCKALLIKPQILLLDEPTKGLDSQGQDQLLQIIKNIKDKHSTAIVIVDHNINQIIRHCDKVLCLNKSSHWHDHKDLLTKNILENIYHCEFEHLLIHENESITHTEKTHDHQFCDHDHNHDSQQNNHPFIRSKKS
jgi:zinc transport system ATP-binding protein